MKIKQKIDVKLLKIGKKIRKNRKISTFFTVNWYAQSGMGQISRIIPNTAQWMGFIYLIEKFTGISISTVMFITMIPVFACLSFGVGYLWKKMGFQDNESEAVAKKNIISDTQYEAAKLILKRLRKNGTKI